MTSALSPVRHPPAPVNPSPNGLVAATDWVDEQGPLRWLPSGVEFDVINYGGSASFRTWTAAWDAKHSDLDPEDDKKKPGVRPTLPDAFVAVTLVASDEGALPSWSQEQVRLRATQVYRL